MASFRFTKIKLKESLERLPMLKVLVPILCGIIFSQYCALPLWFTILGALLCGLLSIILSSSLYTLMLLFFGGITALELTLQSPTPPLNKLLIAELHLEDEPIKRDSFSSAHSQLEAWCDRGGEWHPAAGRLTLYIDSTLQLKRGDRLTIRTRIRPLTTKYPSYTTLMRSRGFIGSAYISKSGVLDSSTNPHKSLSQRLEEWAESRLLRLELKPENRAIVHAMSLGERRLITKSQREEYARSGASHLLAVSGLHVGVLFTLMNILLFSLPLLRRGHLLHSLIVIIVIWLYALMTGMSASVMRAAAMFTALQLSMLFTTDYRGLNTLFSVGCIMLLLNPNLLFDVSFQLSFVAVMAILSMAVPLLLRFRGGFWRWLWGTILISLCATLATAPLTSHHFSLISIGGILINPVVIFTAQLIVALSLVWILLPIGWLSTPLSWCIDSLASLQNRVVEITSQWSWCAVEFHSTTALTLTIYALFIAITLLVWGLEEKKSIHLQSE